MSLNATGITFKYFEDSPRIVLQDVNITVPVGKISVLQGKSGAGKSTLAYVLAGLYPENGGFLQSGTVKWENVDIHTLTPDNRVAYVAMMFQNPDLQFCMNTPENEIAFCLENIGIAEADMPPLIHDAMEKAQALDLLGKSFTYMSGGEKQKCALACILALKSKCIILDEAFANVDEPTARQIITTLRGLKLTILAIDHSTSLWNADHVISLDGTGARVFDLVPSLHAVGAPVITTCGLSVGAITYPNMCFEKGSITAITGKSGAGKTTFFKALMQQHKYKGSLALMGREVNKYKKKHLYERCGIVFQNPANQFLALSVYDEVFFSVNHWHKGNAEAKREKTLELLRIFDLDVYKKYSPYLLSQGQQRRLAVLTMLAGGQNILLLDEPTYGQDYENICAIMQLLLEKAKNGLTVLYTTHNGALARNFSHKIIHLEDNRE
ncbi:MAG: energy-coupling factor ABC transporter ATP-binding protein [Defluviitaleaceae bacterium]|nr:energy-coupling factor ABC transporter ATP-binding protein [Defluviitaleaceae bacterium]MCL2275582.1 energy-coupling factor ABC transporter ATP-binding protein [Defluviitaleaceae bacterium]